MDYTKIRPCNIILLLMWRSQAKAFYQVAIDKGRNPNSPEVVWDKERHDAISVEITERMIDYGYPNGDVDPYIVAEAEKLQLRVDALMRQLANNALAGIEMATAAAAESWKVPFAGLFDARSEGSHGP